MKDCKKLKKIETSDGTQAEDYIDIVSILRRNLEWLVNSGLWDVWAEKIYSVLWIDCLCAMKTGRLIQRSVVLSMLGDIYGGIVLWERLGISYIHSRIMRIMWVSLALSVRWVETGTANSGDRDSRSARGRSWNICHKHFHILQV